MARIHGAASASETVSGNINFYTMYVKTLDITQTGDILDQSQQNLDDIVNIISLVAQPIIMNNPLSVTLDGLAPSLTGSGMLFKFAVEHGKVFESAGDNIAILKELIHGTTIDSVALSTANVEFIMSDLL
jgi:hypothetical protein|tara:strand:+ start:3623 stop:4012 length:390 start_codon:yes stop_codon:yes gene_type:complete